MLLIGCNQIITFRPWFQHRIAKNSQLFDFDENDNFSPFLNLTVPYIEALPLFEGIMDPIKW